MAELTDYSEKQRSVMQEIVARDRGFHTSYFVADLPLAGMLMEDGGSSTMISKSGEASIYGDIGSFNLKLYWSEDAQKWFFTFSSDTNSFTGILHFNTIYQAMGETAFCFLSDSDETRQTEIGMSIPFTNLFIMRK